MKSGLCFDLVTQAIMKQDTEYFDFNPSSTLQERLNRDCDELVENLLHVPRMLLQQLFRVIRATPLPRLESFVA